MFVRKLDEEDWQVYKVLRLEALSLHSDKYEATYEAEARRSDQDWRGFLRAGNRASFGLFDGETMVGIGGVIAIDKDKTGKTALLVAGYIQEDYRGQGYSKLLYEARIGWIVSSGRFDCIGVGHKQGNEASRRANQAFGFQSAGEEEKTWGDGSKGIYRHYEMKVA